MKTFQGIFFLLLTWMSFTMIGGSTSDEVCEEGWIKSLTRCYYYSDQAKNWFSAWEACANMKSYLVSVESDAERDVVNNHVKQHGKQDWWTSGSKDNELGIWAWYGTFTEVVYDNRCTDDTVPIDASGKCLALSNSCAYGEIPKDCNTSLMYVCEKDLV